MGRAPALIAGLLAAAGCGDAAPVPDAAGEAAPGYDVSGVYVDWDTSAPIAGAKLYAHYDDTRVAVTGDDGRFTLRLASYLWLVDVVAPAGVSMVPVDVLVQPAVHYAGGAIVLRALSTERAASLYAAIGAPFDATRGQLLVHLDGAPREVALAAPHAAAQVFDGGTDVLFPNVDLADDRMPTLTVTGHSIGAGSVPLVAGTLTQITVIAN